MNRMSLLLRVLIVAAVFAAALRSFSRSPAKPPDELKQYGPALHFPDYFDLGPRELNDVVDSDVVFRNDGPATVLIDDVRSSCTCTVFEQVDGDHTLIVRSIRLDPGQSVALRIRFTVRATPGHPAESIVRFRTTDPRMPEGSIRVHGSMVKGGLMPDPTSVIFGTVALGSEAVRTVEVRNYDGHPRRILSASSSTPEMVSVSLEPEAKDIPDPPAPLLARLFVRLQATKPGPISASIRLHTDDGRVPEPIPVSGSVTPAGASDAVLTVKLLATTSDQSYPLELPVSCRR